MNDKTYRRYENESKLMKKLKEIAPSVLEEKSIRQWAKECGVSHAALHRWITSDDPIGECGAVEAALYAAGIRVYLRKK